MKADGRTGTVPLLRLADSHCHLDFAELEGDYDAVIARARAVGIRHFLTIGVCVRDFPRVLGRAEGTEDIFCSVGTHPHWADQESDVTADELVTIAAHPKVVGIGEVGLDTFFTETSWEAQMRNLLVHIDAARRTQLPLIVHSVKQDAAMETVLRCEHAKGAFPVVMHCFSGGRTLARANLEMGHYLSFSGLLTYEDRPDLREIAAELPADRVLIETDAPSLAPVPYADQRNEPAYIVHTLKLLARIRNARPEDLAEQTSANFLRAFGKIPTSAPSVPGGA
ncbi:TatD family hydrolase [Gluconacetobacter tumulicola]|uniref:TatD family hydrolase n=1 Tax=Gluconacetobacter tumulicola TaxID=1017177 RepID=A0A7W4JG28_9PROT|nr:TatD family hydrolase [Gluconacetobacter tumulicola]MBB2180594.1 TatD family hydrolase [Gluconacetobacter tumulicola]